MAHNIEDVNTHTGLRTKHFKVSGYDGVETLVVFHQAGSACGAEISVHHHDTANPKSTAGRHVLIAGEDLYAFRELLNELPEGAFVRPADPVKVVESNSLVDAAGDWWAENIHGRWICLGPNAARVGVSDIDAYLPTTGGYRSPESVIEDWGVRDAPSRPYWSPGDRVEWEGKNILVTFLRLEKDWSRTVLYKASGLARSTSHRTDADLSRYVENNDGHKVIRRANA